MNGNKALKESFVYNENPKYISQLEEAQKKWTAKKHFWELSNQAIN